jgi:hypothetical protein
MAKRLPKPPSFKLKNANGSTTSPPLTPKSEAYEEDAHEFKDSDDVLSPTLSANEVDDIPAVKARPPPPPLVKNKPNSGMSNVVAESDLASVNNTTAGKFPKTPPSPPSNTLSPGAPSKNPPPVPPPSKNRDLKDAVISKPYGVTHITQIRFDTSTAKFVGLEGVANEWGKNKTDDLRKIMNTQVGEYVI